MGKQVEALQEEIDAVNRERKVVQETHAARLQMLTRKWMEITQKNAQIQVCVCPGGFGYPRSFIAFCRDLVASRAHGQMTALSSCTRYFNAQIVSQLVEAEVKRLTKTAE